MASSGIRRYVHLPDWSPCHLVCHFATSLRLPSLQMASFARTISCWLVKQVTSKASVFSEAIFRHLPPHRSSLISTQIGFSLCLASELILLFFHVSRSRGSPFEWVNLRGAVRHFRRRTDSWSLHQFIESPARPCLRRGIKWSHAATTFRLAARRVSSNDSADLAQSRSELGLTKNFLFYFSISLNISKL